MKIVEEAYGFASAWGDRGALVSALVEVGSGYYGRLHELPLLKLRVATFRKWESARPLGVDADGCGTAVGGRVAFELRKVRAARCC